MRRSAFLPVLLFAAMCATVPRHEKRLPRLEELTLDQKIGQLFAVRGFGVFMGQSSPRYGELRDAVARDGVGGVVWFASNVYETAELTRRLQREAKVPLLISADLESGMGMRFFDTTFWPPAMAVAATGDPSLAEQEGRVVAREARALGVNHILAPVADVRQPAAGDDAGRAGAAGRPLRKLARHFIAAAARHSDDRHRPRRPRRHRMADLAPARSASRLRVRRWSSSRPRRRPRPRIRARRCR